MRHNTDFGIDGKHCHNCKGLEWAEGDECDSYGWICINREYISIESESKHLSQLENDTYRFKGKRCFEDKRKCNN